MKLNERATELWRLVWEDERATPPRTNTSKPVPWQQPCRFLVSSSFNLSLFTWLLVHLYHIPLRFSRFFNSAPLSHLGTHIKSPLISHSLNNHSISPAHDWTYLNSKDNQEKLALWHRLCIPNLQVSHLILFLFFRWVGDPEEIMGSVLGWTYDTLERARELLESLFNNSCEIRLGSMGVRFVWVKPWSPLLAQVLPYRRWTLFCWGNPWLLFKCFQVLGTLTNTTVDWSFISRFGFWPSVLDGRSPFVFMGWDHLCSFIWAVLYAFCWFTLGKSWSPGFKCFQALGKLTWSSISRFGFWRYYVGPFLVYMGWVRSIWAALDLCCFWFLPSTLLICHSPF